MKYFYKKIFHKNGFTLIEILVTITIVGLLLVISVPNFRSYKNKNDLSRAAAIVQSGIYETRNLALAPGISKQEETKYYVFSADTGENVYKISESTYLPNDIGAENSSMTLIETGNLPENVKFDNDEKIYFSIEKQGKIEDVEGNNPLVISHNSLKNTTKSIETNIVTGQVTIY